MMYSARQYVWLLLAVLLAAGCLTIPDYAKAGGSEDTQFTSTDNGSKIAFVIAFSGRLQGVVPLSVSDMKAAVSNELLITLSERGFTVVPQDQVLALMRDWRVRDGKSIPRGFLESLAGGLGADLLLVANLVVRPDRLVMTGRYLNTGSAVLRKVSMTERVIGQPGGESSGQEGTEWLSGIQEASKIVGDASLEKPVSGKRLALMLDTQPVGCSASVALIASHALLEYFTDHGDRDLIDPAVITATLHGAGYSGKYLGADARVLLKKTFACSGLMIPGFISYDPARKTRRQLDQYDETYGRGEQKILDFAMSLRLVDLSSGSIVAGKEVFLEAPEGAGWFGIPRKETLMTRLRVTAGRLWSGVYGALEEF